MGVNKRKKGPETTMPAGGGGSGRHRYDHIGLGGGVTDLKSEDAGGGCIFPMIRNSNKKVLKFR